MSEPTLKDILDRVAAKWAAIPCIRSVHVEPPASLASTQLPAVIFQPGAETYERPSFDTLANVARVEMVLIWREAGQHPTNIPIGADFWAAVEQIKRAFVEDTGLVDADGNSLVEWARLTSATRFQPVQYGGDPLYIGRVYMLDIFYQQSINPYS